jgi:alkanesulfonate monooxygenase SsuD/methylene tetrahydromethanopterin reductase-like flavin-dependent oxidoreductase (luciferase family)
MNCQGKPSFVALLLSATLHGRCICGLGIGWSKDEYMVSNVPFENRGARADEFIQVLTRIWTDDVVEFRGRYLIYLLRK